MWSAAKVIPNTNKAACSACIGEGSTHPTQSKDGRPAALFGGVG